MNETIAIVLYALIFVSLILWAIISVIRKLIRRTKEADGQSIRFGVAAALATALLIFLLVYLSAWAEMRQQIAMGDPYLIRMMRNDFVQIRGALAAYAEKNGHYPDSLDQLRAADFDPSFFKDAWGRPYHYQKTATGYLLQSFGRDGEPGGVGLDADINSDVVTRDGELIIEPTLWQFVWNARGSRTLFNVAFIAGCCGALAGYISSGQEEGRPVSMRELLARIAGMAFGAILVSMFLITIYMIGDHH